MTGRFSISQRLQPDSALYRDDEQHATVHAWLGNGVFDAVVGPGPGSVVTFNNCLRYLYLQSKDTHETIFAIGLKFGPLGELLFGGLAVTHSVQCPELRPALGKLGLS